MEKSGGDMQPYFPVACRMSKLLIMTSRALRVLVSDYLSAYNFLSQSHMHAGSLIHMRCAFRQTWLFTCHLASHFSTHCSPCQTPIHLSKPFSNIILLGCLCRPLPSRLNYYSLGYLCALNIISSVAAGSVYWFLN